MPTPNNPFILCDNRFADAVPVASSTASGAAVNLTDFRPYTGWTPSALPANVVVDSGYYSIGSADTFALFNHNLFGCSCVAEVHGSTDNFVTSDVTVLSVTPTSDASFISNFAAATYRYWKLLLYRFNQFQFPNDIDNAYWGKSGGCTVTPNTALAPDSTMTSDTVTDSSATLIGFIYRDFQNLDFSKTWVLTADVLKDATPAATRWVLLLMTFTGIGVIAQYGVKLDTSTGSVVNAYLSGVGDVTVTDDTTHWKISVRGNASSAISNIKNLRCAFFPAAGSGAMTSAPSVTTTGSAGLWGMTLQTQEMPTLTIAALGVGMQMPIGVPYGFDPLTRKVFGQTNISEQGLPLGKAVLFEQWAQTLTFKYVDSGWIRSTFLPAWKSKLRGNPFLFAFNLASYPNEIYLVEAGDTVKATQDLPAYSTLSFDVKGVALP